MPPQVLLDQNAPRSLRQILTAYDVKTAFEMGWDELVNGQLLSAAERAGFSILVTCDQNIVDQQQLAGRKITLLVLGSTRWPTIREHAERVRVAIDGAGEGSHVTVPFPKPPLRRRPLLPPKP